MSEEKLQEIKDKVSRCEVLMEEISSLKRLISNEVNIQDDYCEFSQDWLRKVFDAGVNAEVERCQKELDELLRSLSPSDNKPNATEFNPWERVKRNLGTEYVVTDDYAHIHSQLFASPNHKATS